MSLKKEKLFLCEITPRTESAAKSPFVKISTGSYVKPRMIPLEQEVYLTKAEIDVISRLSEPTKTVERMSISDIMKKYRVSEEIANEMVKDDTFNTKVKKKFHYKVVLLRKQGKEEDVLREEIAKAKKKEQDKINNVLDNKDTDKGTKK